MSKIVSLLVVQAVFCFSFIPSTYADSALIKDVCKKTPYYDLCVSILETDPRSSISDVVGLAHIAAESVKAKAIAISNQIGASLGISNDPNLKTALNVCLNSYNTILRDNIPIVIEAIVRGDLMHAVSNAADAGNEAQICEESFRQNTIHPTNTIYVANQQLYALSVVLQFIASLMPVN
ncbi:hypothetical protein HRI_000694100 [Hibiscus trionum]|uniref:Pectinesterase inhibitor domain-containing protein n=1 Tax=Hibiscus trionum TaxID=183268 RepID=A0A9W7LMM6_HIBTR|nr:hypothetical protein HRI_000694100 [Hibiscus trionum]